MRTAIIVVLSLLSAPALAAQYRLTNNSLAASAQEVMRETDGATIGYDVGNDDFQVYLKWLAAGNTPDPAPTSPPPVAPTLTFLQFMALFTPAEQSAIVNSTDAQVKLYTIMAAGSGGLQLNSPQLTGGVGYLVTIGILTSARATAVLAGQPPS